MPALAVSYSGLLGGAERVLLEIAVGLPQPPLLACPPGPLADAARAAGLGVFPLRERSLELRRSPRDRVAMPLRLVGQATEVRALVRGQRPDLLIAWGMRAGLAVTLAYPPGTGPPILLQHVDLLPGPQIAHAVRAAARRADHVVVCSDCIARDLDPAGALGARLTVVPLGVDLTRFRPEAETTGRSRKDNRAGAPLREALLLGAIERWKRPDVALEAVALAAQRLPGLRLRVVGRPIGSDGEQLLAELRERAAQPDLAGRVELVGSVDDPGAALRRADCLLHCADREPYGMVVAEALASGLPVVVPASCGPAEIADASCGRLYAPGDPTAAATALEQVLGDGGAMRTAARAHAEQHLDLNDTRGHYADLIASLGTRMHATGAATLERRGATLAIVTVIHDSEPELRVLLETVARYLPDAQVVVVDSGSSDGGAEAARGAGAEVLDLGGNLGFGRGVNAGLARVTRPVAALLNPDVELLDASLHAAAEEVAMHPQRLLAPEVLTPDGERQDSAQREPGSPLLALHAVVPGGVLPARVAAAVEPWRASAPRRVGWAVGCAIVGDTETLRALGPFDERTFMYGEDLDLGLRAADAAVETWFWPAARLLHHGAHASEREFGGEPFNLLATRRREVILERRGTLRIHADDALQATTFATRAALKTLLGRDTARERRQLHALRRARRAP